MLSQTSKYALRVLVCLSWEPAGSYVLGRTLAERAEVPANYLSKLLLALGNEGYVDAMRGQGGGYRLNKPARDIKLAQIVRIFEGTQTATDCILGVHEICSDENPCSAHDAFRGLRSAYLDFLGCTTIKDVASHEKPSLLGTRESRKTKANE